jgi:hypothetical protein
MVFGQGMGLQNVGMGFLSWQVQVVMLKFESAAQKGADGPQSVV